MFASEIGTPLDAGNVLRRAFRRTLERAQLPHMPFHSLRHTSATLAIEAGVHPRTVADRLGHATPSLVMNTYGHVTQAMQADATAALERVMAD